MSQNTLTGEKLSPDRPITYSGVNWCPVFEREVDHCMGEFETRAGSLIFPVREW